MSGPASDDIQPHGPGKHRSNGGFTLIEMIVVLAIIGILLTVAIPTFIGSIERSQDRTAQLNLDTALIAAKTVYYDLIGYGVLDTAIASNRAPNRGHNALASVEPALRFLHSRDGVGNANPSTEDTLISYAVEKSANAIHYDTIKLAALSDNDVCWFIWSDNDSTHYGYVDLDGWPVAKINTGCDANAAERVELARNTNIIDAGATVRVADGRFRSICFYEAAEGWPPIYRPADIPLSVFIPTCPVFVR